MNFAPYRKWVGWITLGFGIAMTAVGIWELLQPVQFEAMATISIEKHFPDGMGFERTPIYDPYFFQTEFEKIQSTPVLDRVIKDLKLADKWRADDLQGALRRRLRIRTNRQTGLIEIVAYSENPREAADIANALAKAYRDYRPEGRVSSGGIQSLRKGLQKQEEDIKRERETLDRLKADLPLSGYEPDGTNRVKEFRAYFDKKQEIESMELARKALTLRIKSEELDLSLPKTSLVKIESPATVPATPLQFHIQFGRISFIIGLLGIVTGLRILRGTSAPGELALTKVHR